MSSSKKRRKPQEVNAGSMADIAFLLLIFFLVTTTIMEDSGIRVRLPVWEKDPPKQIASSNNILSVKVNVHNKLMVEGEEMRLDELKAAAKEFVMNPKQLENRPPSPKRAAVSLQNDRSTNYEAYIEVYDQLVAAYRELWEERALLNFGKSYDFLSSKVQKEVRNEIPMTISEAEPTDNMDVAILGTVR
jgi:biopolymer transport protein ExbD